MTCSSFMASRDGQTDRRTDGRSRRIHLPITTVSSGPSSTSVCPSIRLRRRRRVQPAQRLAGGAAPGALRLELRGALVVEAGLLDARRVPAAVELAEVVLGARVVGVQVERLVVLRLGVEARVVARQGLPEG